jgi:site-specific DNA-methyltransferase (adenine-specific)
MASSSFNSNTLYYGDNLDVLRKHFPSECVDLIYLDPPFNSKADYNVLFKERSGKKSVAQAQAFSDSWTWDTTAENTYLEIQKEPNLGSMIVFLHEHLGKNDMMAYLVMMTIRLKELHRVLKPTGSLYLHCDTTASHYLKLLLDGIFGTGNFRNEIIWKRFNFHADAKRFGRVADRLLFYSKTDDYKFERQMTPYKKAYIDAKFTHKDENGRKFRLSDLNPPAERGPVYELHGITRAWRFTKEKMLQLEKEGRIYIKSNVPQLKRYLDELEARGGAAVHEIWDDIPAVNSQAKERLGYPTQKPIQLLERIIKASSKEGDWILDPFCGCGTTIMAAQRLNRNWVGIDVTHLAISLIRSRLKKIHVYAGKDYKIFGEPVDLASAAKLAKDDKYQFQYWAVSLIDAFPVGQTSESPYGKKGADKGVDGWLTFKEGDNLDLKRIVIQVKGGENIGAQQVRDLVGTVESRKSAMGILITLIEPTKPMKIAAMEAGYYESPTWGHQYPKIQIITISELFHGKKPNIPHTHD